MNIMYIDIYFDQMSWPSFVKYLCRLFEAILELYL